MSQHEGRAAERQARRKTRWRRITVITSSVLGLVLIAGGLTVFVGLRKLNGNITTDDLTGKLGSDRPDAGPESSSGGKPLNILLVGSDSRNGDNRRLGGGREDGQRSDTTILLHVSGDRKHATALSFPRDAMVAVPSCVLPNGQRSQPHRLAMFNSAFADGGTACTIRTVEKLTDIRVDHHLVVDFKGFAAMVDAIDGVEICLPTSVDDRRGHIRLDGGRQTVRGEQALDYVRLRYDRAIGGNGGDLGRIKRQQAFLSALATKVKSTGVLLNPPKLFGLLNSATRSITTDPALSSIGDLAKLAQSLRGLETKDIAFVTVPVHVYPPDPNRLAVTQPVADQLFAAIKRDESVTKPGGVVAQPAGPPGGAPPTGSAGSAQQAQPGGGRITVPPSRVSVRVLNGSGTPGRARQVAEELRRRGFRIVSLGNSDRIFSQTLVRYPASRRSAARTLQAAAPGSILKLNTDGSSSLSLIVGKDFDASQVVRVRAGMPAADADVPSSAPPPVGAAAGKPSPPVEARTADRDICG